MAKIFISVERELANEPKIDRLVSRWEKEGEVLVFSRKHSFSRGQEKEMMQRAREEIKKCDVLVVASDDVVGVGIEVGIAFALGKRIVLEIETSSSTLKGVANI